MTQSLDDRDEAQLGAELAEVVSGRHRDPHRLLGIHVHHRCHVVRAWLPGAQACRVLVDGRSVTAQPSPGDAGRAGLFLADLGPVAADTPPPYQLAVTWADGNASVVEDPYRFWPTLGPLDLHLLGEGRHEQLWKALGARLIDHQGVQGTAFAVWAPSARAVRVVGDWNFWNGRVHPMRTLGTSGVWELFVPAAQPPQTYKFEIVGPHGELLHKADPFARAAEAPPRTSSRLTHSNYEWGDDDWLLARAQRDPLSRPLSTYECHLGSWRRGDGDRVLSYRDLATTLVDYVVEMGFTHVQFMPLAEHPFGGSWGYQVTSYFAPTARYGTPDDFRFLVDAFHQRGIGVLVDWVPAHFPKDDWALARFDGTELFEHSDPRQGEHPDWGTLVFNLGRNEVRNFLVASALYWIEEFHLDGLRVDAVASMLYLDYSRKPGEWVANRHGGRENLEAVAFLQEANQKVHGLYPGTVMIAEESTAWPNVSRPVYAGGLGFTMKWNMGWMHDTLAYFSYEPVHRQHHHHQLTFGLLYAFSENFVLPLSHDEVVHGKGSLLTKMPGDRWRQMANLRALYGWMWAHPGRPLLFMGGEIAQDREWSHDRSLDWPLLASADHAGMQALVRSLNLLSSEHRGLWELDFTPDGFRWIDADDPEQNVISFLRRSADEGDLIACVANFSPVVRHEYRLGVPKLGSWEEILNTDAAAFGGTNVVNGALAAGDMVAHGLPHSVSLTLPPLGVVWLAHRS